MKIKEFLTKQKEQRAEDLKKCNDRIDELEGINETAEGEEDLKNIGEELDALKAKKADLEAQLKEIDDQIAELDKPAEPEGEGTPAYERKAFLKFETRGGQKAMNIEERKANAEKFAKENRTSFNTKETRSILVSGGKIATPTEVGGINDAFNPVSSIVDLVKVEDCAGMGAHKVAYVDHYATAADHTEGAAYEEGDPVFGFVEIKPNNVGVLSYLSREVKKQSPLDYEEKTKDGALKALRVKAGKIVTDAIIGSANVAKVNAKVTSGIGVIDEHTLRDLVLAYGGDETVGGEAVLFLNKKDLIAFGDVRGTDKKPVYEITPDTSNTNTGTIQDGGLAVKYCLNSNIPAINGTTQPANSATDIVGPFYGNPLNAELDLFGDYEVAVSEEFAFNKGLLTIRGDVSLGSAVVAKDGFVALVLPKKSS